MISILTFTTAAALVLAVVVTSDPQQTHLVYEQHFLDTQSAPSDTTQTNPSFHQTPFQPFPQEYSDAPNHYQNPVDPAGYGVNEKNNNNQVPFQQQPPPVPHHMGYPQQQLQQPGHFQPNPHQQPQQQHAIGIPMPQPGMHNQQPPQFMNQAQPFMNHPPPGGFQQQPQMIPVGMSPSEFANRRGPLDKIMGGGRPFKRGKKPRVKIGRGRGPPVKMMEMNRIPKPPKYPLYDMPSIGMATPPPAPLMHPMSHMAASNAYSTFVKPSRDGPPHRRNHQPQNRRRPLPQPQIRQGKRPPPGKQPQRNHRRPYPGKKHFQAGQNGYEHPMASNLDPQVNSPPLGRPLNFDEYMERPSHSFTDDPWNFDPFAAQYNSGMNTANMKYNYDPLGMNVVDGSQSHLDPSKLSYPGDYFSVQDTSTIMKSPKTSQIGGWDKPAQSYRNSITNLLPPALEKNTISRGSPPGHNRHQERFDQRTAESRPNSFNVFDSTPADSQIVKSESLNPISLLNSGGSSPPIEFSIESSGAGDDHYQNQYNIGQEATPQHWQNYNHPSRHPYQSTHHESPSSHSYREDSDNAQSQNHENYARKPNEYDNAGPDHYAHARKEDYIPRERPLHDLSDSYSPMGEINTAMAPPHDDSQYSTDGMRSTRQEKTPMVEVEGLSLFKDVLKNANASVARKHLYSALLN